MQPTQTTQRSPMTPDERATEFRPVEGGGEMQSGAKLLVEAYAVLWVILMAWIYVLWRKGSRLHARLDDLERAIDARAPKK